MIIKKLLSMKELDVVQKKAISGGLGWDESGNWVDCLGQVTRTLTR